eukprot:PhF_6_TR16927/c0_g1_i1/m.25450/K03512/POLL; DNA polymerase lambda
MKIRIPRKEVAMIESIVAKMCFEISPTLTLNTCGSYRRGKPDSGDVDILLCDRSGKVHDGVCEILLHKLFETKFLLDELGNSLKSRKTGDADSWMGFCKVPKCANRETCPCTHTEDGDHLPRRLDVKVYPKQQYPFAILYFTGSDYFNRSMRLYCQKKGLSLSDKDLRKVIRVNKEKVHEGEAIPCETEEDIFKALGLQYKTPEERNV